MSFFKRTFIISVLSISMFVPLISSAQTDNSALIAQLLAQIKALSAQLQQLRQQQSNNERCHTFNTNLGFGNAGSEMSYLTQILEDEGFPIAEKGNIVFFGESTASAVTGFQEKYRDEILTPNGLKYGTGYVGKATRAKLNQLYGCGSVVIQPTVTQTINISPISGSVGSVVTLNTQGIYLGSTGDRFNTVYFSNNSGAHVAPTQFYSNSNPGLTFQVPSSLSPGVYQVNVENCGGKGCTESVSTSFTVTGPVVTQSSITVLSPNGGEVWTVGSTQTIRWNPGSYKIDNVGISIFDYNAPVHQYSVVGTIPNSGSYNWTIPNTINGVPLSGNKYKIEVGDGAMTYDQSDLSFSIAVTTSSTPSIFSISPTSVRVGDTVTIYGSNLYGNGVVFDGANLSAYTTTYSYPDASGNSMTFTVPSTASVGSHTIQVEQRIVGGLSNAVTLNVVAIPNISYISPTSLKAGDMMTVYGSNLYGNVFSIDGNYGILPSSQDSAGTSVSFVVPWNTSVGSHMLRVEQKVSGVLGNFISFNVVAQQSSSSPTINYFNINDAQQVAISGSNFTTITLKALCPAGIAMVVNGQWATDSSRSLCNIEKFLYKNVGTDIVDTHLNNMDQFQNMIFLDEQGIAYLGNNSTIGTDISVPITLTACNTQGACVQRTASITVHPKG